MTHLQQRLRGVGMALCVLAVVETTRGCSGSTTGPKAGTIASVVITPDSLGLNPGGTSSLHAAGLDAANKTIVTTGFFWSTSDSLVVAVSQAGVVTAQKIGAAQISASSQGHSGFATVIVVLATVRSVVVSPANDTIFATAPGNTARLTATAYDALGHVLTDRPVIWSANTNLLTVAGGALTGTGVGAGTATVTATSPDSGFPSGSAKVTVLGHVSKVVVSPAHGTVSLSGFFAPTTLQMGVKLTDSFGNNVTGSRSVKWSSSNSSVAKVNASTGLVTAVAESPLPVTITATTTDGATGSGLVAVEP